MQRLPLATRREGSGRPGKVQRMPPQLTDPSFWCGPPAGCGPCHPQPSGQSGCRHPGPPSGRCRQSRRLHGHGSGRLVSGCAPALQCSCMACAAWHVPFAALPRLALLPLALQSQRCGIPCHLTQRVSRDANGGALAAGEAPGAVALLPELGNDAGVAGREWSALEVQPELACSGMPLDGTVQAAGGACCSRGTASRLSHGGHDSCGGMPPGVCSHSLAHAGARLHHDAVAVGGHPHVGHAAQVNGERARGHRLPCGTGTAVG